MGVGVGVGVRGRGSGRGRGRGRGRGTCTCRGRVGWWGDLCLSRSRVAWLTWERREIVARYRGDSREI